MKITRTLPMAAVAGLFALAACTDVNTATGDPNTRAKEGAAIGAATGVAIGILQGNNPKGTRNRVVRGAIVGGALGAVAGSILDKQAADLQKSISNKRVQIINTGNELIVRMPQDILFDFDSAEVSPTLRPDLKALAKNLQQYPDSRVFVYGHTDSVGTSEYNLQLSQQRAAAVASILISRGVSAARVRAIGRGEDEPIASNLTPEGRAQNRRVEIVIRPN